MLDGVAARTLLFTVLVPGTVTIVIPAVFLRSGIDPFPFRAFLWGISSILGAFCVVGGALLYAWSAFEFVRSGRGTPAPFDPPRLLVITGPFATVRNPIYVAIVVILLGESLLFGSGGLLLYSMTLAVGFHFRVTRFEEPSLEKRFGPQWRDYHARVSRWLPRY